MLNLLFWSENAKLLNAVTEVQVVQQIFGLCKATASLKFQLSIRMKKKFLIGCLQKFFHQLHFALSE